MDFTYNAYLRLLQLIIDNGYEITDYNNAFSKEKSCILRHDIDTSPAKALEMAKLEKAYGEHIGKPIFSTYFVLVNTSFYNICFSDVRLMLQGIVECGHDIGLHFDETRYDAAFNNEKLISNIEREIQILRGVTGAEIKVVSMHRPSKETLKADLNLGKYINSYSSKYFNQCKYLSDSRMHWRENVRDIVSSREYNHLHILTHPFWYAEKEESTAIKLKRFIREAQEERYLYLNDNFRDLNEFVGGDK